MVTLLGSLTWVIISRSCLMLEEGGKYYLFLSLLFLPIYNTNQLLQWLGAQTKEKKKKKN